jgi:hypothetical protein
MKQWISAGLAGAVAMVVVASAGPLQAQATVLQPDRKLSPSEDSLQSALYQLRDTLAQLSGTVARMERDFRQTSDAALISRAREIHRNCLAADRNLPGVTAVVTGFPEGTRLQENQRRQLLGAITQLHEALAECTTGFEALAVPGKGDEIRGYGNARLMPLRRELLRYDSAVDGYFRSLRIPNRPLGSKANPIIGHTSPPLCHSRPCVRVDTHRCTMWKRLPTRCWDRHLAIHNQST